MFIQLNERKGQSTLEYAVIIGVVVGALIMMQVYVKRGLSGRIKSASDEIGDQFSPTATESVTTVNSVSSSTENVASGSTKSSVEQTQCRSTNENTKSLNAEGAW